MKKLLIVDDHKIIRDGLRFMLNHEPGVTIAGECKDGSEVCPFLKENAVDIILMDIRMQNLNGIEATKLVVKDYPEVRVIALTMFNENKYIEEMLQAGASGYILKESGKAEVMAAIDAVARNENYYSDEVTKTIMARYSSAAGKPRSDKNNLSIPPGELTEREREVLILIAEEYTNMEIGKKLHISNRTVDTHRRNLIQKLGVKNTAGLVRYAIKSGLMDN